MGIHDQYTWARSRFLRHWQFQVFTNDQIPILTTQLTLSHRLLAPKRYGLGICCKCRLKSTVRIKHIDARAWHNQPFDWVWPIQPSVKLSKVQSGELRVTWPLGCQAMYYSTMRILSLSIIGCHLWQTGSFIGGVLLLCRGAVSILYSPSWEDAHLLSQIGWLGFMAYQHLSVNTKSCLYIYIRYMICKCIFCR